MFFFLSWPDIQICNLVNYSRVFVNYIFSICACLLWRMYFQSAVWFIGRFVSHTNTSWYKLLPLVLWYIERTYKAAVARITIHGSASYTHVSCRLYVHTRFSSILFIIYVVAFACGFPVKYGLFLIPYYFSINIFFKFITK